MPVDIGKNIKKYRKVTGMAQEELSIKLGMSKNVISRYEENQRQPCYDILFKIAKALNVTLAELFGEEATEIIEVSKPKGLKDYTTDELLKEILKRVNMKQEEI